MGQLRHGRKSEYWHRERASHPHIFGFDLVIKLIHAQPVIGRFDPHAVRLNRDRFPRGWRHGSEAMQDRFLNDLAKWPPSLAGTLAQFT